MIRKANWDSETKKIPQNYVQQSYVLGKYANFVELSFSREIQHQSIIVGINNTFILDDWFQLTDRDADGSTVL